MPAAWGACHKYAWMDHDTAYLNQVPPVSGTWYTVGRVYDFRELLFAVYFIDDEANVPVFEVRWKMDGNTYFIAYNGTSDTQHYFIRNKLPSLAGTQGLFPRDDFADNQTYDDKRGQDGLFEVRVTQVLGTSPILRGWLLYETLEVT